MSITYNLENILKELDITKNHIAVETKTRPATVLSIAKGDIKRIDLDMINNVLDGLNKIAKSKKINKSYTIDDIFTYKFE